MQKSRTQENESTLYLDTLICVKFSGEMCMKSDEAHIAPSTGSEINFIFFIFVMLSNRRIVYCPRSSNPRTLLRLMNILPFD